MYVCVDTIFCLFSICMPNQKKKKILLPRDCGHPIFPCRSRGVGVAHWVLGDVTLLVHYISRVGCVCVSPFFLFLF